MYKLYAAFAIALACSSAHAQREYQVQRDARSERAVDDCIDDRARGERLSRKEMKKLEERCSRRAAEPKALSRDRQLREREVERPRSSPSMPDGPQGRNLRGVPDTSGAP